MSRWTHSICDVCWVKREGGRVPHRVRNPESEGLNQQHCCFCGNHHSSGIYVREDPNEVACKAQGPEHEEEE